jgi:hypothetical protein
MTPKELTKLAKACRKLGITTYKGPDFEFTLGDEPTPRSRSTNATKGNVGGNEAFQSDSLEGDALLYWSVGGQPEVVGGEE